MNSRYLTEDVAKKISPEVQQCIWELYDYLVKNKEVEAKQKCIMIFERNISPLKLKLKGNIKYTIQVPTGKTKGKKYTVNSNNTPMKFYERKVELKIVYSKEQNAYVMAYEKENLQDYSITDK